MGRLFHSQSSHAGKNSLAVLLLLFAGALLPFLAFPQYQTDISLIENTPTMRSFESLVITESSDLYYFGKPMGLPVVTSQEHWDENSRLVETRKWDLHGQHRSWKRYAFNSQGKIRAEQQLDANGEILAEGAYGYLANGHLETITWHKAGQVSSTWGYSYNSDDQVQQVKWLDTKRNIIKSFNYSYSEGTKTIREQPNQHGGFTDYRYNSDNQLIEKSAWYYSVRLDDNYKILPGEDANLESSHRFSYHPEGDLYEVETKGVSGDEYEAFERWEYLFDQAGRLKNKHGSYKGKQQVIVTFDYLPIEK